MIDQEKIIRCLSDVLEKDLSEVQTIGKAEDLSSFGMDSITFIRFILAVEEAFGITINDSDLLFTKFDTLGKVHTTLQKYLGNGSAIYKKCIVLDCDNVLWQGIASEDKIIPNIEFQTEIVNLYENGVLISLCSKNDEFAVKEIFDRHSEMPLRWEYVLVPKINWNDKVDNIKAIAEELNISTDSMVFVDDSDYEIGAVESLLPEVLTIKFEDEVSLQGLFDTGFLTDEGKNRTELYIQQKSREKAKQSYNTIEEYNDSLQTKVGIKPAEIKDIPRIGELSLRTNQFNLSMKRYDEATLEKLITSNEYCVLAMSSSDIYGDMGVIGAAVLHINGCAIIEAFMQSCRVIGRGFECQLLAQIKRIATEKNCTEISGIYIETEKNSKFASFYEDNGVTLYG